ncbi:MAG TPA: helix-hairpin-helix domain-containing protein [Saprospiraceae bacterium]|nr:helix-hairpin-helix domain-containing protein [Saprospiraceae bacterium]
MTNKDIAKSFQLLGDLMELHGENSFKIRSYQNAYRTIRRLPEPLAEMNTEDIASIKGIGKAILGKINELLEGGTMTTLERYKSQTPEGVQEMLKIKGFGPKKIKVIWEDLGVESIGELLYAVNENRLIELKGFGAKTQEDLRQKLEYYQKTRDQFHYATLLAEAEQLISVIKQKIPKLKVATTGALRRAVNTSNAVELLVGPSEDIEAKLAGLFTDWEPVADNIYRAKSERDFPVHIFLTTLEKWGTAQFKWSTSEAFLQALNLEEVPAAPDEEAVFEGLGLPYIAPELRENTWALELARHQDLPDLLEVEDIKGVVHSHSTYSDGLQSLAEMAEYTRAQGYEYLVITDHSKSAFYANGLSAARVLQQFKEVEELNQQWTDFTILKGIESDILSDGSLDYEDDLLAQFEVVIASVHSNLRMDEAKANQRLLKAIENPYTHILGHPTGRLLLSRKGYPIDHQLIIDACAANGVAIELNANPYRLDLDWSWIPYALEKDVLISINPDAHSTPGIHDIKYGVASARKGGLTAAACLNARSLEAFKAALK